MGLDKEDVRDELQKMVDEYLKEGGKIEQVPVGVTSGGIRFHSSIGGKSESKLYEQRNKKKNKKAGFHTHTILLKQS